MTNTPNRISTASIRDIASLIADIDPTAMLSNAMTIRDLALAYDICPIHACDIFICADDDIAECAELRA